ncbi:MAG: ISL3 family transposase [Microcoleus anatoxicus]
MTEILNLPGTIVEEIQEIENTLILFVKSASKTAICPRCGQRSHRLHQNKRHLVKDLPWGEREVMLSYRKSVKTIRRWFGEIVGYFESRTTNGVVEGINNKLKLLKRSGFGFRNFDNFQLRALLLWHLPQVVN